ncbi:MAG: DEAD/DEAH box helicase [Fimbriimonas sp.]|nr:DEAD/DEAH box helicase [Fimbriimonas sp.]
MADPVCENVLIPRLFEDDDIVVLGKAAPIVLRDYQQRAKAAVLAAKDRGLHRVMVVMPTGTGKTTLFASLVDEFERSYRETSLVVAHRLELLHQAANRIVSQAPRLQVGIEGGDLKAPFECHAVVAAVQTLGRPGSKRLDWFQPGLLIMDEGHHAPADTWQNVMRRFGSYDGTCFTLAVTATDHRMDNKPLHGTEESIFEDVVFRYPLSRAVSDGWLVDLRGYRVATGVDLTGVKTTAGDYNVGQLARAVNTEARNHTAFKHWSEIAHDRRTIVFCVDVQHAKDVAALFREHGVSAESVDGTMPTDKRGAAMSRFSSGRTQVLTNVDVATEGFDIPHISCVLMLRPTQSWGLYTQMAGRGVRVLPGVADGIDLSTARRRAIEGSEKPDCLVIDVVDVSTKFGLNGPPDDDDIKPERKPEPASVAGMMGLPADFDLQGHSLFEAAKWIDELTPAKRAQLFRRPMSFENLSTVLSEVDLIKELSIPEEIIGISRLAWMKTGDSEYMLPCGSSGFEKERFAKIETDLLGRLSLTLLSQQMTYPPMPLGTDLAKAFDEADRMIRLTFPDCGPIVQANASWREKPPSEKQIDILRKMGVEDDVIALVETMGQARALIEQRKLGGGRKRRRGELA